VEKKEVEKNEVENKNEKPKEEKKETKTLFGNLTEGSLFSN
jgi:hypothetical protein